MAIPNYNKDKLYDSVGILRMKDSFLSKDEKSPQERLCYVCNFFGTDKNHSRRLYEYCSNHWLSLSSPILSYKNTRNELGISCFLCKIPDTVDGMIETLSETNRLSVNGGGVSIKMSLRSPSEKAVGAMSHIKTYDSCVLAYKQGTRRGSYVVYMDIDHPEIIQFIDIRKPTGDYNMRCLNIHHAINISDKFMDIIEKSTYDPTVNDDWDLIDPHTGKTVFTTSAKMLWQRIIETRMFTGEPYICFIDTCNNKMNKYQKEKGMKIEQSNLCSEIIVPTDDKRSSLCCLASLNLEYFDDWKNNELFIRDTMELLDNVLNNFIAKANPETFKRTLDSAINEKNIGMGVLGFHAYLQKKGISIESDEALNINRQIFKWISDVSDKINISLGKERGSPRDIKESGKRFSYTMAIAPTATTSIIMGNTSPSIEPYRANIYRQDTVSGSQHNKNKFLTKLLVEKGFGEKLQQKIWKSILMNEGSVQHLPEGILSADEKKIFKTFIEIDQMKLIDLAAERQKYIDQGQSVTLTFDPDEDIFVLHNVHLQAWKKGLKTLYYCRSIKVSSADKLTLENDPFSSCQMCQS